VSDGSRCVKTQRAHLAQRLRKDDLEARRRCQSARELGFDAKLNHVGRAEVVDAVAIGIRRAESAHSTSVMPARTSEDGFRRTLYHERGNLH
jgi:hypothetical protein